MEEFAPQKGLNEQFNRFETAAAKGHEESMWILSVVKDMKMEKSALKEVFAKTEEPLGWFMAGEISDDGREQFDFYKKSAEGGCSWGQVRYGRYFNFGNFVEKDDNMFVEWLEKAANQNNPKAIEVLGYWFGWGSGNDKNKAVSYFRAGAELGCEMSMKDLAYMLKVGEGCAKDLRQAVIWYAKVSSGYAFWNVLDETLRACESGATEKLDCNFNQLCYSLGWGLYWYQFGTWHWNNQGNKARTLGNRCLDYYCSCVELQQKSIFTFLLCWNQTAGVKDVGVLIAQTVWEEREGSLLKAFDEENRQEPETKRIKK
jgi:TPR repeat protein